MELEEYRRNVVKLVGSVKVENWDQVSVPIIGNQHEAAIYVTYMSMRMSKCRFIEEVCNEICKLCDKVTDEFHVTVDELEVAMESIDPAQAALYRELRGLPPLRFKVAVFRYGSDRQIIPSNGGQFNDLDRAISVASRIRSTDPTAYTLIWDSSKNDEIVWFCDGGPKPQRTRRRQH
jgi:hypothetical protein